MDRSRIDLVHAVGPTPLCDELPAVLLNAPLQRELRMPQRLPRLPLGRKVTELFFVESGSINFYIDQNQVVRMAWYTEPHYSITPIGKLQPGQELWSSNRRRSGNRNGRCGRCGSP